MALHDQGGVAEVGFLSKSGADPECELHAPTIAVVFELLHNAVGCWADEPRSFSTPFCFCQVAGFETEHQISKSAFLYISRKARRLDALFNIIDIDGKTGCAAVRVIRLIQTIGEPTSRDVVTKADVCLPSAFTALAPLDPEKRINVLRVTKFHRRSQQGIL